MGSDLIVGRAGLEGLETSLTSHLAGLGLNDDLQRLFKTDENVATLCFLNIASLVLFLDHVAVVEGYPASNIAFAAFERGESGFKNFPWWVNSIWLPFDFEPRGNLEDEPTLFVGSCQGLLRELTDLKQRSPLGLGSAPNGYERMRQDIRAFYREDTTLQLDDSDIIRWMWRALFDGAESAIEAKSALWL